MIKKIWIILFILIFALALGCQSGSTASDNNTTSGTETDSPSDSSGDDMTDPSEDAGSGTGDVSDPPADDGSETGDAEITTPTYAIVDTGQDLCYDTSGNVVDCGSAVLPGQDGAYTGNTPRYQDNGDGTVSDLVTGLMWQQDPGEKMTLDAAMKNAEFFSMAGYNDWRMPTIKELYSLIQFNGVTGMTEETSSPYIDTDYFIFCYGDEAAGERMIDAQYASSTKYVGTTMNGDETVFGVNFADGRIKGYGITSPQNPSVGKTFFVLYVRGNTAYGKNQFQDNGDGTITDTATGLMWMQQDSGGLGHDPMNWSTALSFSEELSHGGYSDWRLPSAKELQSIVDYTRSPSTTGSPAINPLFASTEVTDEGGGINWGFYWTSTTHLDGAKPGEAAAYIAFGEALGWMQSQQSGDYTLLDVHGAGAQRGDPKTGDPDDYPYGFGPQGDVRRIYNMVRCVRDVSTAEAGDGSTGESVGVTLNTDRAQAGKTLIAPMQSSATYLINNDGSVDRSWSSDFTPGLWACLTDAGQLVRTTNQRNTYFSAGGSGGGVEVFGADGSLDWSFTLSSDKFCLHHDVAILPDGNLLMTAWESISAETAMAAGRNSDLLKDGQLWPDKLIEVAPDGNGGGQVVWEWRVMDHLVQDSDASKPGYGVVADHPERIHINFSESGAGRGSADWTHINGIDYNEALDQILLTVHGFSEIWVIDHSTTTAEAAGITGGNYGRGGDLLYRWGNPQAYDVGTASDQMLFKPHDANWIASGFPGEGNILVFNNGKGRPEGNYSSVDELTPPMDGNGGYLFTGSSFGPSAPTWSYTSAVPTDFYADHISGAQRLLNGNTLICNGVKGTVFEVTNEKETVWEFVNPYTRQGVASEADDIPVSTTGEWMNQIFKVRRYEM